MSGRWTSSANETEAAQSSIILVTLVDLDFVGGHVRAHDGLGTLSFGGNAYLGVGIYGGVDQIAEDLEVSAKGVRLTLSGVPADMTPDVLAETDYQNRAATLYVGLVDLRTNTFIDTPEEVWSGVMDYMEVSGGPNEVTLTVAIEDELRRESVIARYSDEDQKLLYPGDTFFADLPNVANTRAVWGQRSIIHAGGGGGGPSGGTSRPRPLD